MDLATFARIVFAQGLLQAIAYAVQNLTSVQLPFPNVFIPLIAAALNALAARVRQWAGTQQKAFAEGQGPTVPWYARVF